MAMNGNTLGDAMRAAIDAVGDKTDRTALFRAMGNAIVSHIQGNANATGIDAPSGDTHNLTIT